MKNIRLFELEEAYHEVATSLEYPTVSYTKDTDKVWYTINTPSLFEFVDLGLPSGLKWATCNIGATKPEEVGLYFGWGETQGYTIEDVQNGIKLFGPDYKFVNAEGNAMTKYNETDGLVTLETADDAATALDKSARMPTKEEFEELIANTTVEMVNNYNESGRRGALFTSNSNGNSIFLPACGGCINGYSYSITDRCGYWSSSIYMDGIENAYLLSSTDGVSIVETGRWTGLNIRPVKK